jgi:hypothetical protein
MGFETAPKGVISAVYLDITIVIKPLRRLYTLSLQPDLFGKVSVVKE